VHKVLVQLTNKIHWHWCPQND